MPGSLKRLGIGVARDVERVIEGARSAVHRVKVIFYCRPGTIGRGHVPDGCELFETESPELSLVNDLASGRIDAAVRGTLPANATLRELKTAVGADRLERIALLETADGIRFLLAPVGVDEGWTVEEKVSLIRRGKKIAKKFGLPEKTGVLSGGRLGDIGRHARVDGTIADAKQIAALAGADHCEILIEEAVKTCGLIIAPDGISGNLIFRTLVFLGGGQGHGAPVVNISRIFVDTSRASPNYGNALLLAASLLE